MSRSTRRWVPIWAWGSLVVVMAAMGALLGLLVSASRQAQWGEVAVSAGHTGALVGLALVLSIPVAGALAGAMQLLVGRPLWRLRLQTVLVGLDGVPSVVYGLAAFLFAPLLGSAAGIVALAAVSTPPLATALDRTMTAIEPEERLAAMALGASPVQVLAQVVAPASARLGLVAIGRAALRMMGVVAPLLILPSSVFEPLPLAAIRSAAAGDVSSAAACALVLLGIVIVGRVCVGTAGRAPNWRLP